MNRLFAILCASVVLVACGDDDSTSTASQPTTKGSVSGFVSGSDTGGVLKDAIVKIVGKEITTLDDGVFDIKEITAGEHIISAMKTGYASYSTKVTITDNQNTSHDIVLDPVVVTSELSCLAILNANASQGDGYYQIDVDASGPIAPFDVYCDMTNEGGGWTLYGRHADGIAIVNEVEAVTLTEYGVMKNERWIALRNGITTGMLFVDELGNISTMAKDKLLSANCQSINDIDDLSSPKNNTSPVDTNRKYILWNEVGCDGTGGDYTNIQLLGDTTSNYDITGASLWQGSALKFDIWPYSSSFSSYSEQDELLYFIK